MKDLKYFIYLHILLALFSVSAVLSHSTNVTVGEVMTRQPKSVGPDTKLPMVQRMLQENNIHAVPVVDAEHHLLGIVDSLSCLL